VFLIAPRPLLGIGNRLLAKFGRPALPTDLSARALAGTFVIGLVSWAFVCAGFATLVRALELPTLTAFWRAIPHLAAAYPVAYAVGFLSFLTPGGLAVREGTLFLLLGPIVGPANALVVALAMRALEVGLELAVSGSVLGLARVKTARAH
jgi:hypothetical protein